MNLKQTFLFILLIVIGNLCQAQTLYLTAEKKYHECTCEGSTDGDPKVIDYDVNGLLPCWWENEPEGTFEIVIDEVAKTIIKKLGETEEVFHIIKYEIDDNNKRRITFHVTNQEGEKTQIYLNAESEDITFYYTKDGKYKKKRRHDFEINYAKIRKENEKKN